VRPSPSALRTVGGLPIWPISRCRRTVARVISGAPPSSTQRVGHLFHFDRAALAVAGGAQFLPLANRETGCPRALSSRRLHRAEQKMAWPASPKPMKQTDRFSLGMAMILDCAPLSRSSPQRFSGARCKCPPIGLALSVFIDGAAR
jgi:hypothetical protein